jgi:hypothetical protein
LYDRLPNIVDGPILGSEGAPAPARRYGSFMEAADRGRRQQTPDRSTAEVPHLQGKRVKAQQAMAG